MSRKRWLIIGLGLLAIVGVFFALRTPHSIFSVEAWSPDGAKLLLTCGDQICVVNTDGSGFQILTHLERISVAQGLGASWSPDGTQILVWRYSPSEVARATYLMNSDGSSIRRFDKVHSKLIWSPDGRELGFSIGALDVSGNELWELDTFTVAGEVEWSPSGDQLAFIGQSNGDDSESIYLIDANGTNLHRLPGVVNGWGSFAWSPSGEQVAYVTSNETNGALEIFISNKDGGDIHFVTEGMDPQWFPDGKHLAYSDERQVSEEQIRNFDLANDFGVYTISFDGSDRQQLTSEGRGIQLSSDGTTIAFAANGLYLVSTTGSGLHSLDGGSPVLWSPDGTNLAYRCTWNYSISNVEAYHVCIVDADGSNARQITPESLFVRIRLELGF